MHDPSLKDGNGNHVCKVMHCTNYPVQKCFNVCGVITGVMAAITCLSPNLYLTLTTPSQFKLNIYVQDPTEYSKFLRQVIMCWIAEDSINIHHVIPTEFSTIEADEVSCTDTEPNTSEEELEEEEVVTNSGMGINAGKNGCWRKKENNFLQMSPMWSNNNKINHPSPAHGKETQR